MKLFLQKVSIYIAVISLVIFAFIAIQSTLNKILPNDFKRHPVIIQALKNKEYKPEIVVLGDSRAMFGINAKTISENLPNNPITFNLSSVGQNMQEGAYFCSILPQSVKTIIHCVDYATFTQENIEINNAKALSLITSGFTLNEDILKIIQPHPYFYRNKIVNLYEARSFFKSSLHVTFRTFIDNEKFDTEKYNDLYFPYIYKDERHPNYPNKYKGFNPDTLIIANKKIQLANKISSYLNEKNIQYNIVLMPLNPDISKVEERISNEYIANINQQLPDIKIINLYNLLESNDFYDGVHPNRKGAEKISKEIANILVNNINNIENNNE
jgi:hypothetical protein